MIYPVTIEQYVNYENTLQEIKAVVKCYNKNQIERLSIDPQGRLIKKEIDSQIQTINRQFWLHNLKETNVVDLKSKIEVINTLHKKLQQKDLNQARSGDLTQLAANKYNEYAKVLKIWNDIIGSAHPDLWIVSPQSSSVQNSFDTLSFTFKEVTDDDIALTKYFQLLDKYPEILKRAGELNDHTKGTYEIAYDLEEIKNIRQLVYDRLYKKFNSHEIALNWSRPGVVFEDSFWLLIRDAVTAPSGFQHMYNRLIWKSQLGGIGGAAILPIIELPNGEKKVILNLAFRHATGWEFEIPRGASKEGETAEQTATRELKEETGCESSLVDFLINMTPDTGALCSINPIFMGSVKAEGEPKNDKTEAIAGKYTFTFQELEKGMSEGQLTIKINEENKTFPLRDPFLAYAYAIAKINGKI